ncbi:TlpA disulfide reductase family protein [uncultured Rikenella sp.]|uniref:TlpA family protein disulfide reductase n=1 Tax=uncultured Rikenella sp. TaxID=368003 RepID=UPI002624D734|nr:TlpA disulfide reductase family protein [uncultured Rikenella sp.]
MKNHLTGLLCAVLLLTACSGGGKGRLTVTVQGLPDDSLICSWFTPATIRERGDMTTFLVGGTRNGGDVDFSIDIPDDGHLYKIFLAPQSFRGDGPRQNIELFLLPGEGTHVRAVYEPKNRTIDYSLDGSPDQQRWMEQKKTVEPLQLRLDMLSTIAMMISPERRNPDDSIYKQIGQLTDSILQFKAAYIGAHPADPVSGFFLATLNDGRTADSLYRLLDESVRQGPLKEWLDLQNEMTGRMLTAEEARKTVVAGAAAPDFTLPDTEGKDFTLSSLYGKGKYTVLDFWGTWCGWCMKGMPAMKEAYGKYKASVEFVGVDCGDTEEDWKQTVASQGLPWINVRAAEDDIPVRFGLEAYPTKMVIDPQGVIVARYTGEDPAFYATLDSLVNKR